MIGVVAAVAGHPSLWPTALRQARRLVPRRWWRSRPFLPMPSRQYLEFRMLTQYGDNVRRPIAADVLNYLRWCRDWERVRA